ncbi:ER membrane protein complex subunit 10-like [Triticum urartu]|uniref:ER membrane protein complex subunit 10 n=1 Tax=Triticum urartu TaxID=4572 RepID=A0A8R7U3Y4_TRIUA|nr:ER membrane protein complex subunit 10-like [Triticum urartu]XP_048569879.1 ER membrane protein complex subunit 10-like [Triticum urartu]
MAARRRSLLMLPPLLLLLSHFLSLAAAFQSDELLLHDDDEFEGTRASSTPSLRPPSTPPVVSSRRRSADATQAAGASESNTVQFTLEHDLGAGLGFGPAGSFSARLKSSAHGSQTLTKLRFTRNELTEDEKNAFKKLLEEDSFYTIRLPSNVLDPTRNDYIYSSIKARCIPRDSLDEHIVIHMDGVNILAVNYGSVGGCQYPRPMEVPSKWTFNSYTILKTADQAPRTPSFVEQLIETESGLGEVMKPPEKSFWAKYWMYIIPLGLIVMNAVTAAANIPEEQAGGQGQAPAQRAPIAAPRRR